MSIIIDKSTSIIVQGITGREGSFHTKLMKEYGTNIVAGVRPGKKGECVFGVPVFDTVKEALDNYKASFSIIFVPAKFAKDAALEALENDLNIVIITEGIPVHDTIEIHQFAMKRDLIVIGPNTPGICSVGECKVGIMPNHIFRKGDVGIVSRSGTLTYEIINELSKNGIGQSTVVGIGGDKIVGLDFIQILKMFEEDKETKKMILIGEIGSDLEERAAKYIEENVNKKVVAYIVGRNAPKGKRMGHAGAIIRGEAGTAKSKIESLERTGVEVAKLPSGLIEMIK